ncbi:S1C family serine protease [Bythopirellula polymerisocia]|uniref:Putative serine protease HhoA n=1 Tax=Bythopirellula polymerisocia TaxID=2528003 RepID=A0A5C6CS68_9BACT|nr:S1C family serine protease [Bythopirellula polymerisocia]TWU27238.1 putative serine protease HhoA precursor [Bythopirellula polymerisocia]
MILPKKLTTLLATLVVMSVVDMFSCAAETPLSDVIRSAQTKVVKIFGAGGLKQLEAYQTGILISPSGHVLTARSYVLDTDDLAIVLDDGRSFKPEYLGSDPIRELALLKLPIEDESFPHFDLQNQATAQVGDRVLALSNLYGIATGDEPVSVLQGAITAIAPLDARRGAFATVYRDNVYVVDAYANNPGAAGGALVDWQGRLLGLLGKEVKSRVTGTWLNYALPTASFSSSVNELLAGHDTTWEPPSQLPEQSLTTERLGMRLVPDVLPITPPYLDAVRTGSPAEKAGLRADDLIVFVGGRQIASCRALLEELTYHDEREEIEVSLLRDGELVVVTLQAEGEHAEE